MDYGEGKKVNSIEMLYMTFSNNKGYKCSYLHSTLFLKLERSVTKTEILKYFKVSETLNSVAVMCIIPFRMMSPM